MIFSSTNLFSTHQDQVKPITMAILSSADLSKFINSRAVNIPFRI